MSYATAYPVGMESVRMMTHKTTVPMETLDLFANAVAPCNTRDSLTYRETWLLLKWLVESVVSKAGMEGCSHLEILSVQWTQLETYKSVCEFHGNAKIVSCIRFILIFKAFS